MRREQYRTKLERFAELLSRDLQMSEIRERMGITKRNAYHMFSRLRADLGPQAR